MEDIRHGICPLCSHNEVVQGTVELTLQSGPRPLSEYYKEYLSDGSSAQTLNVFVCRRCGLAQWFAFDAASIPIGKEYGTKLIRGPKPEGPYR